MRKQPSSRGQAVLLGVLLACIFIFALLNPDDEEDQETTQVVNTRAVEIRATRAASPSPSATSRAQASSAEAAGESTEQTEVPPTLADELFILENVQLLGGIEVFPMPDRASGRIFAAVSNFKPHVAGRSEDGEWLYILYFMGNLQAGWGDRDNVQLTESQFRQLAIIDPHNPPLLPELAFNEAAARPFGAAVAPSGGSDQQTAAPTSTTLPGQPTATPVPTLPALPTRTPYPAVAGAALSCQNGNFDFSVCPSYAPAPRNCDEVKARGIPERVAACCFPGRDADKDGYACYGN